MGKMRYKVLSIVLALVLAAGLLPSTALADIWQAESGARAGSSSASTTAVITVNTLINAQVAYAYVRGYVNGSGAVTSNETVTPITEISSGTKSATITNFSRNSGGARYNGYLIFFLKASASDCLLYGITSSGDGDIYSLDSVTTVGNIKDYGNLTSLAEEAKSLGYVAAFGYSRSYSDSGTVDASFSVTAIQATLTVSAVANAPCNEAGQEMTFTVTPTFTDLSGCKGKVTRASVVIDALTVNGKSVQCSSGPNGTYIVSYTPSESEAVLELSATITATYAGAISMTAGNRVTSSTSITKTATATVGTHNWDNGTVDLAPTCTSEGVMTYTCQKESDHTKQVAMAMVPHDMGEWSVAQEATCEEDGSETRRCKNCGKTEFRTIKALGHTYGDSWSLDGDGHWKTCIRCDATSSEGNHNFGEWQISTSSSCTGSGVRYHVCDDCKYEESDDILATGHSYGSWTDSKDGKTHSKTCAKCDDVVVDSHHMSGWSTVKEASCTEAGKKENTCTDCGYKQEEAILALGHDLVAHAAQAATCIAKGWNAYETCDRCDYSTYEEQAIDPNAHDWDDGAVTTKPTCTDPGVKTYTCKRSDEHTKPEKIAIDPTAHNYVATDVDATCETVGYVDYVCSYNKEHTERSQGNDALGHLYKTWTDNGDGTHISKCERNEDHVVSTEEHDMGGWSEFTGDLDKTSTRTCEKCGYTEMRTQHTVTFDSKGGSAVASVTVMDGQAISAPTAPTRSGNTFVRWNLNGAAYDFSAAVTQSITLTAQWRSVPLVVTPPVNDKDTDDTTEIVDEDVPLAGTVDLLDEHIAYIQGYAGLVRPEANITREEVATIFYRLLSDLSHALYDTDENSFTDVPATRWSNVAISTLANAGIVTGDPSGAFRPQDKITRAEFATIVARFWVMTEDVTSPFTDTAGHWAEQYIAFAASNGWVDGYGDGTFRPTRAITRAEAVKMVNRMMDRKVDEQGLLEDAIQFPDNANEAKWYYYEILEASNGHDYARRTGSTGVEDWTQLTHGVME